jgi:hypothetical protein
MLWPEYLVSLKKGMQRDPQAWYHLARELKIMLVANNSEMYIPNSMKMLAGLILHDHGEPLALS